MGADEIAKVFYSNAAEQLKSAGFKTKNL